MMNDLFSTVTEVKSLYNSWRKVRANRGVGGVDQISWFGFEQNLDANLAELSRCLRSRTYQPLPAKFVLIAKANGKTRELGILTIRDRVAQRAVLDMIEPIFEAEMDECNYAFRVGRNVEMAIREIILNRANGFIWTVESDIQNYFAEIDCRTLMSELKRKISDENILHLINLWIEAGILRETEAEAEKTWWRITQENLANLGDVVGETVNDSIGEFVSNKLGLSPYETDYLQMNPEVQELLNVPESSDLSDRIKSDMKSAKSSVQREALKKVVESSLVYALSNRAFLARVIGLKFLGIGGAILAGGMFAPKIYDFAKDYFQKKKGILQGSPISPLLANIYLTKFDKTLRRNGFRLVRYCDDFVISCRTNAEANLALNLAKNELGKICLTLHPEKTRILSPSDEFEFLGYKFTENGSVEPPPSIPQKVAEQIRKASSQITNFTQVRKLQSWESLLKIINRNK